MKPPHRFDNPRKKDPQGLSGPWYVALDIVLAIVLIVGIGITVGMLLFGDGTWIPQSAAPAVKIECEGECEKDD